MSLETECKKVAINLQQLTDAITTLTVVMELKKPVIVPEPDASVSVEPIEMGDAADVGTDVTVMEPITTPASDITVTVDGSPVDQTSFTASTNSPKVDEPIHNTVVDMHANIGKINEHPTMQETNMQLQKVVAALGDGGAAVRQLIKSLGADTLTALQPDKYHQLVEEAQALVPAEVQS